MSENNEKKNRNSKKKKKKKISIVRIIILLMLLVSFIGAGIVGGLVLATIKSAKPIDPSKIYTLLDENSFILDKEGNVIEKVESDGLRTIVKYDKIPNNLKNAFIAIEDQDFFSHKGINPKRILKAIWEDIKAGAPVQGASTITQQLAKNLYLSHDKTISRKIKEVYYSFELEKHLTKEQILEAYLNTAYMGSGAKGVQAAAYTYFSKDVEELDLAEASLLAGITKNPSRYSPLKTLKKEDVNPNKHFIINDDDEIYTTVYDDRYKDRQQLVLSIMKNENMISEEEYTQASNEDLKDHLKPGKHESHGISSYFVDQVKKDVVEAIVKELGKSQEEALDMLYNQGLRIYSTMDLNIQKIVEKTYQDSSNFPNLVSRKDKYGNIINKSNAVLLYKYENLVNNNKQLILPKGNFEYDETGNLILYKGKRLNFDPLYENGDIKGIRVSTENAYIINDQKELELLLGGVLKIPNEYKRFDGKKNLMVEKEFLSSNPEFFTRDANGNLLISYGNYTLSNKGAVQPQSAMVIIDYKSGEIKALVGGRDISGKKLYNRAINPRPPGSSIKPLAVYTPALDNGWTAGDIIDDVPHYDANGKLWPRNWYKEKYWGLSTLRKGVQFSMNVMAVDLAEKIGIGTSLDYLKKMGITSLVEKGPSNDQNLAAMALGGMTKGISPLELTAAYGSIANEGVYIKPKSFVKITDREGNIVLENNSYQNVVVGPDVAFIMTDMMRSAVSGGTASRAKLDRNNAAIPVAGKTGTTSDNYDAWFAGYTPYYVGGVWIGNDIQMKLDSGSAMSAKLWQKVMSQVHQNLPPKNFTKPDNVISVQIDTKSGKLPTQISLRDPKGNNIRSEYFIRGTEPKKYDDVHVELEVDITTNKLATPYCPPTLIEKRVFTRRPVPYDPAQNNGIVPTDFIYEAPTEQCDVHNEFNGGIPIDIPSFPPEWIEDTENTIDESTEDPIEDEIIDSTSE